MVNFNSKAENRRNRKKEKSKRDAAINNAVNAALSKNANKNTTSTTSTKAETLPRNASDADKRAAELSAAGNDPAKIKAINDKWDKIEEDKEQKGQAKKMTDLISSFILFFAIPILVCSIKILTIMKDMIKTTKVVKKGDDKYDRLIFMIIVFLSIFTIIKTVLGDIKAFIYSLIAGLAVCYKVYNIYTEKNEIATLIENNNNINKTKNK